jgi:Ca2+-binding EF-hand superfamily protein
MGPAYDTCVKCYAGTTTALSGAAADLLARNNRDHYFHDIAEFDDDPNTISLEDFANHVEIEKLRTGLHATTASTEAMFRAFDANGSGFIERDELDNDEVKHGLAYPQAESDKPDKDKPDK